MENNDETIKYKAKPNAPLSNKQAQIVGEAVTYLNKTTEEGSTGHNFVMYSKDKKAPTHSLFKWTDDTEAHKWRMHQARMYMNSVIIEIDNTPCRAFYPKPSSVIYTENNEKDETSRHEQKPYIAIEAIMQDTTMAENLLYQLRAEVIAMQQKYTEFRSVSKSFKRKTDNLFKEFENFTKKVI